MVQPERTGEIDVYEMDEITPVVQGVNLSSHGIVLTAYPQGRPNVQHVESAVLVLKEDSVYFFPQLYDSPIHINPATTVLGITRDEAGNWIIGALFERYRTTASRLLAPEVFHTQLQLPHGYLADILVQLHQVRGVKYNPKSKYPAAHVYVVSDNAGEWAVSTIARSDLDLSNLPILTKPPKSVSLPDSLAVSRKPRTSKRDLGFPERVEAAPPSRYVELISPVTKIRKPMRNVKTPAEPQPRRVTVLPTDRSEGPASKFPPGTRERKEDGVVIYRFMVTQQAVETYFPNLESLEERVIGEIQDKPGDSRELTVHFRDASHGMYRDADLFLVKGLRKQPSGYLKLTKIPDGYRVFLMFRNEQMANLVTHAIPFLPK